MDIIANTFPFFLIVMASIALKYACDPFEQATDFLGRNFPPGVSGALLKAVGSSMPEMFTMVACLFFYSDIEMLKVGLGTTAGSAIFNGCVIPALAILMSRTATGMKVDHIELNKRNLIRDIFWMLFAELTLIYMLSLGAITIEWVIGLNMIYVGFVINVLYHVWVDIKHGDFEPEEYEFEELETSNNKFVALMQYDFNKVLFNNKELNLLRAWTVLVGAVVAIAFWCHILVEGVLGAADVMGVAPFVAGMILGSAASSIPDLILSVKDAMRGQGDDAIANPIGSNTFDTTISFGLPLVAWMMWTGIYEIAMESNEALTEMRWSIVAVGLASAGALLVRYKKVTRTVAWFLLAVYVVWFAWVLMGNM